MAFYIIGAIVFELFASAEPQKWGVITKSETNDENSNDIKKDNL